MGSVNEEPAAWIPIAVPAIVSQDHCEAAQARLEWKKPMARRNHTTHPYLLRGLVSCGQCRFACIGRAIPGHRAYSMCRGRRETNRTALPARCRAPYTLAQALDAFVWHDLCRVLSEPALIVHELKRAPTGEWLPQALQARRRTLGKALAQLERQHARLLDVSLGEVIGREAFERTRQEIAQTQRSLRHQLHPLEAQPQQQIEVAAVAQGLEAVCQRVQPTLAQCTFAQKRQLVELLIDRVIVNHDQVEMRYVVPTGPQGEAVPFCHLRLDYQQLLPVHERSTSM